MGWAGHATVVDPGSLQSNHVGDPALHQWFDVAVERGMLASAVVSPLRAPSGDMAPGSLIDTLGICAFGPLLLKLRNELFNLL